MSIELTETPPEPFKFKVQKRLSDRVFRGILITAGLVSFVTLAGIFGYLARSAAPVLKVFGAKFFTSSVWYAGDGLMPAESADPAQFGILPMLWGSLLISIIAIAIAIPVAIGISLAITYFLPKPIAHVLTLFVDLVAAIPSVVFGLWGFFVLMQHASLWAAWLNHNLGFIPIFKTDFDAFDQSPFMAGLVLSVMITPIITAVAREIFSQVPPELINGAHALGSSRWTMIRHIVLPFGKSGIIGGAMLGMGRALGETVAVFFVLQLLFDQVNWYHIVEANGGSVASLIVSKFGEASPFELSALFGAGLALFVVTLVANAIATTLVNRSGKGN
jgi:phosphate transport system permease protein